MTKMKMLGQVRKKPRLNPACEKSRFETARRMKRQQTRRAVRCSEEGVIANQYEPEPLPAGD